MPPFRPTTPSGHDGSQTSMQSYADLARTVDKLRQEVDALRGIAPDPNISPRTVSAFRWIQVDRQNYDDIYVVNYEVLNRALREMLRVALPGVRVDDVEFSWSMVKQIAQQIIWDNEKRWNVDRWVTFPST